MTPSTSPWSAAPGGGGRDRATLTTQGPDKFDATLQNPLLDAVAASKPDALLVAPERRQGVGRPAQEIQDAGSKVVLVDTVVDDASIGVSRIATDNKLKVA